MSIYPSVSSQTTQALWLDEALACPLSSFPLPAGSSSRVSDLGQELTLGGPADQWGPTRLG